MINYYDMKLLHFDCIGLHVIKASYPDLRYHTISKVLAKTLTLFTQSCEKFLAIFRSDKDLK